jgi:ABC-type amino acid transport substrate-binding protein
MSTKEHVRGAFDRFTSRIGCLLALLPLGAACLLAASELLRVSAGVLLLGVLVTGLVLDGAAPRGSTTPTPRRPSYYERVRTIIETYEAGKISAAERDLRLREINNE